jgi:hypothetical protein
LITQAQEAYEEWKKSQKASLMVYTEEQIFEIGFNAAQNIIKELSDIIVTMEKDGN